MIFGPPRWEIIDLMEKAERNPELITDDEKIELYFFGDGPGLQQLLDVYYDNLKDVDEWFNFMYVEEDEDWFNVIVLDSED